MVGEIAKSSGDELPIPDEVLMSLEFESATEDYADTSDEPDAADDDPPDGEYPREEDGEGRREAGSGATNQPERILSVESDGPLHGHTNGSVSASIEVVLRPLSAARRAQYTPVPPSDFVSRVLSNIPSTRAGEEWYQIEYDDGAVDQVSPVISAGSHCLYRRFRLLLPLPSRAPYGQQQVELSAALSITLFNFAIPQSNTSLFLIPRPRQLQIPKHFVQVCQTFSPSPLHQPRPLPPFSNQKWPRTPEG